MKGEVRTCDRESDRSTWIFKTGHKIQIKTFHALNPNGGIYGSDRYDRMTVSFIFTLVVSSIILDTEVAII